MEFKKELQLKRKNKKNNLKTVRQQQSELLKSFNDVQQAVQSQMQKQAELQQQQMQQNNQMIMMMMMMMQMMQSMKRNYTKTVSNRSGIYAKPNFITFC